MNTRRDFLRKGAFAGLGMLTMSELAKAVVSKQNGNVSPKIKLEKDSVILFQGDSITDMTVTNVIHPSKWVWDMPYLPPQPY